VIIICQLKKATVLSPIATAKTRRWSTLRKAKRTETGHPLYE